MMNNMNPVIHFISGAAVLWGSAMALYDPEKLIGVAEGGLAVLALAAILLGWMG
jgi:hypothetical protein